MNTPLSPPTFIYCRGCGQQIHPQATACPHCGAPHASKTPVRGSIAPAVVSCVLGVLALLGALGVDEWGRDEAIGLICLCALAGVCGLIELTHMKASPATAVVGLTTAGIALLVGISFL